MCISEQNQQIGLVSNISDITQYDNLILSYVLERVIDRLDERAWPLTLQSNINWYSKICQRAKSTDEIREQNQQIRLDSNFFDITEQYNLIQGVEDP